MDDIYLSPQKLADLKVEYTELCESLNKENEEASKRGGPMDSFKEAAAFSASLQAKESIVREMSATLANAKVLPDDIPGDTIVLGKWFSVKSEKGETKYRLVHKIEAYPAKNLVSRESPLGTAVLNLKQGDKFSLNGVPFSVVQIW